MAKIEFKNEGPGIVQKVGRRGLLPGPDAAQPLLRPRLPGLPQGP